MLNSYIISFLLIVLFTVTVIPKGRAGEVVHLPNYSLKYSVRTSAEKSIIWRLWADVENWKSFDARLTYSYLVAGNEFGKGAVGYLKAKNGPKTKFEIIEFKNGVSFTESLKIPLYQTIELQRYFEDDGSGSTVFTHEVNFKGALRSVAYFFLYRAFKKDLQLVVERLKMIAEYDEAKASE